MKPSMNRTMKIETLKISNVKGQTRKLELTPLTVIHGPNWSGKTAVLTAIRMGLLGYDPKLGKRPGDTFMNATGSIMSVDLHFARVGIHRNWKSNRGSVKLTSVEPPGWPGVPALMLDVREYFGMSGQARRDYIMGLLSLEGAGISDESLIAKLKTIKVEPHGEAAQIELDRLIDETCFWMGDRDEHGTPLVEWMAGNLTRAKERVSELGTVSGQQRSEEHTSE